jgi:hypothetical protein
MMMQLWSGILDNGDFAWKIGTRNLEWKATKNAKLLGGVTRNGEMGVDDKLTQNVEEINLRDCFRA